MFEAMVSDVNKKSSSRKKKDKERKLVTNNILYSNSENPEIYFLIDEYLTSKQINYFNKVVNKDNQLTYKIIYSLKVIPLESDLKSNIGIFYKDFSINLNDFIPKYSKVISLGRSIYNITYGDTDINMQCFEDFIFNKTYFYAPDLDSYIFPVYTLQTWLGKDTFERFYTLRQIKICNEFKAKPIRKIKPNLVILENPNELLFNNLENTDYWALDIETSGLNFIKNKIKCVTLCNSEKEAYYLRWEDINIDLFNDFLKNKKLIGANLKFDLKFLIFNGIKRENIKIYGDTFQLGHVLNEMRSNSLKTHSWLYTYYGGYELELDEYKRKFNRLKDYSKIPERILYKYACMDVVVTYKTFFEMQKQLDFIDENFKEQDKWSLRDYYEKIMIPAVNMYVDIELDGVYYDWNGLEKLGNRVKQEIEEAKIKIKQEFNLIDDINLNEFFDDNNDFDDEKEINSFFKATKETKDYNVNSNEQLAICMEKAGYPCYSRNKKGLYNVNDATLKKWEKEGYKGASLILHLHKLNVLYNTFIGDRKQKTGYWKYYNEYDEKLHSNYGVMATNSGRNWCIAKGTKILVNRDYINNPEGLPIEDIKVGDYVYSFNKNKKLVLNKVLNIFNNGYKEVLKIKFKSLGNKKEGELICTPNHKIRLYSGEYVKAKDLLNSNRRLLTVHPDIKKDRLFIGGGYYKNNNGISTYRFIYESMSNEKLTSNDSIHHKDNNHKNHEFNNLEKMTKSEHSKIHYKLGDLNFKNFSKYKQTKIKEKLRKAHLDGKFTYLKGEKNPNFLHLDRFEFLKDIFKAKGNLTKINHDFNTLKEKIKFYKIPLEDIKKRFSKNGIYLYKGKIEKTLLKHTKNESLKLLNIGHYKLNNLLNYYNMNYYYDKKTNQKEITYNNHYVTLIEKIEEKIEVFDLEVENDNNYIANEICVHNCKSPNLQQQPQRGYLSDELKKLMVTKNENWEKIELDFNSFQLAIGAILSGDKEMENAFVNLGGDLHSLTSLVVLNNLLPNPNMTLEEFLEVKKIKPFCDIRQKSKGINFQLEFGASAFNFAKTVIEKDWTLKECKDYILKNNLKKLRDSLLDLLYGKKNIDNSNIDDEDESEINELFNSIENKEEFSYYWTVAIDLRKKHFKNYSGLFQWINDTIISAEKNGYIKSVFGAFRRLPRLLYQGKNDNQGKIKNLKNISLNTGVQNFEISVNHLCMIEIYEWLKKYKDKARIYNMVHDSCKFYVHKDFKEELKIKALDIFQQYRKEFKNIPITCEID